MIKAGNKNLIDKDNLLRGIEQLKKSPWYNNGSHEGDGIESQLQYCGRKDAIQTIIDLCINKEFVIKGHKQGKWVIDDKEGYRIWHCHCSICKKDPQDYIGGSENWWLVRLPNYCPNCGAELQSEN